VTKTLPLAVFSESLNGYAGYDVGRVPFELDIKAFFRISDSQLAAQRVSDPEELSSQLTTILQGSVRTILAGEDIETILSGRATFGKRFTEEVDEQLKNWGVTTVKMIELLDIRDAEGSKVIANLMAKKKSLIEMESRVAVAENSRAAREAEINAEQSVELRKQDAQQAVGIREANVSRDVGIAKEQSTQEIKAQAAVTARKEMDVNRVHVEQAADIDKNRIRIEAEAEAAQTVVTAEAALTQTQRAATGIQAMGEANAAAAKALQLAPVEAQIVLAKEIGENTSYQQYLVTVEQIKAGQTVGVAQAEALKAAAIKVLVTGGTAQQGIESIGELMTSSGGARIGSFIEGMKNASESVSGMIDRVAKPNGSIMQGTSRGQVQKHVGS
jgi:flotillin